MAEFRISRFRYTWEGNWTTAVTYNRDDVVYYRGSAWVCIRQHNSSTFNADITYVPAGETLATPAWVKMSEGRAFLGIWTTATLYESNEVLLFSIPTSTTGKYLLQAIILETHGSLHLDT